MLRPNSSRSRSRSRSNRRRPSPLDSLRQAAKSAYEWTHDVLSPSIYPKLKFQIASDIHLEMPTERPPLGIIKLGDTRSDEERGRSSGGEGQTPRSRRPSCFTGGVDGGDADKKTHEGSTREVKEYPTPPTLDGNSAQEERGEGKGGKEEEMEREEQDDTKAIHSHPLAKTTSYLTYTALLPPKAQYLILAGDIGLLNHYDLYLHFLKSHLERFERLFLVLGNHEFYSLEGGRPAGVTLAKKLEHDTEEKVQVLYRKRVDIPCPSSSAPNTNSSQEKEKDSPSSLSSAAGGIVTLLGCTLNSYIPPHAAPSIAYMLNDFRKTPNWTITTHNSEFLADLAWLKASLKEIAEQDARLEQNPLRRVVIVTHHAPTFRESSKPRDQFNEISPAFCTELLYPGNNFSNGGSVNNTSNGPRTPLFSLFSSGGSSINGGNATTNKNNTTPQPSSSASPLPSPFLSPRLMGTHSSTLPSSPPPPSSPPIQPPLSPPIATTIATTSADTIATEQTTEKTVDSQIKSLIGAGLATWPGASKVTTWIFGHTHFCTDYVYRGDDRGGPGTESGGGNSGNRVKIRIVANQRGYWWGKDKGEGARYDPGFVVEA